jgi:NTE family protein
VKRRLACFAVLSMVAVLAGCAYPIRNDAVVEPRRPTYDWHALPPGEQQDTLVIVTMSGGGTRATALAMSVLRAMDKIKLASGASLADEIDIVSSVSGGSVTAGYFALYGTAGLQTLETNFVRQDGMRAIIAEGLNPIGLALLASPSKERIDLLVDYLDRQLFHDVTFEKLVERKRRPYLILNAADMVEGTPFPFTQYTMDLLCSDLTKMKLSTAVAASAAFPVALSPITLKNYRTVKDEPPCPVRKPGWLKPAEDTSWYLDPPRVAWQRTASAYADGQKKFIHLLDGGIADNLGVSEPYRLLTSDDVDPLFKQNILSGKIKKIVFIMINARSFTPSALDNSQATPGALSMLTASIDSSIDRATFSTSERIRSLLTERFRGMAADIEREANKPGRPMADVLRKYAANLRTAAGNTQFITVDFDAIADKQCRAAYHSIQTSWALSDNQLDGLNAMGEALLAQDPSFPAALRTVNAQPLAQPLTTVPQACAVLAKPAG